MSSKFTMVQWAARTNIYEVNIRQYTPEGTFRSFMAHLPRLKDMGVEILWLMPVTPISVEKRLGSLGSYYACSSYTALNPEFGDAEDFKALVQEAHGLGMKLIIDWVANHTGYDHEWTRLHPSFYVRDTKGNFTERNGWEDVIDLDYSNAGMRKAMVKAMQGWVTAFDIDGFRCDMAHLVPLDFWQDARLQCDSIKPLFWLAECDDATYLQVFDTSYAWEWMHVSGNMIKGNATLMDMRKVLEKYLLQNKLYFTSNHDENSWNGTEYEKYGMAAKTFAVLTATWPGIPLIYSGQELPNTKRLEFFHKDQIEWGNTIQLHAFYKTLFAARTSNPAFGYDAACMVLDTGCDDKILAWLRVKQESKVLVIINFSDVARLKFSIKHPLLAGSYTQVFSGLGYLLKESESYELQPWEYLVYEAH